MKKKIDSSTVKGKITAPASKSVAQRAVALAALTKGTSIIRNVGNSNDVLAAINVCKKLGVEISGDNKKLNIKGGINIPVEPLNCDESGLSIRMFSPIVATMDSTVIMTGEGSLKKRPMHMITESLTKLGAMCITNNGFLPIEIKGPIYGGEINIDGSISSQVLTGILMAAPYAKTDVYIKVNNLKSTPYIDLTINMMHDFGVSVYNNCYKKFIVKTPQNYHPVDYNIEGDWSGAAFLLVAGAIAGEIEVTNLNSDSSQADRAIIDALKLAGANVSISNDSVKIKKNNLRRFDFDATHCPDLFPPLVALAANCEGESTIIGIERLKNKESNRAETIKNEFNKLGVKIKTTDKSMIIQGGNLKGGNVFSHNDHRIAMSCAIAALNSNCTVIIENAEAVSKSYPLFFNDLENIMQQKV